MSDFDRQLQDERRKRDELRERAKEAAASASTSRGISLASSSMDSDIYGGSSRDDSVEYETVRKRTLLSSYSGSKDLINDRDVMQHLEEDPFADVKKRRISERESEYQKRWRKARLSPERSDPWADMSASSSSSKGKEAGKQEPASSSSSSSMARSYKDIMAEQELLRKEKETLIAIKKKEQQELEQKRKAQVDAEVEAALAAKQKGKFSPQTPPSPSSSRKREDRHGRDGEKGPSSSFRKGGGGREEEYAWGAAPDAEDNTNTKRKSKEEIEEEKRIRAVAAAKPDFGLSGALAADSNKDKTTGVVMKWSEPPEMRGPDRKWRLYVFKNNAPLGEPYKLRQPAYLFGREAKICDIILDHPHCSSQHAVLCFRQVKVKDSEGTMRDIVKPYLIDLQSKNFTYLNSKKIEDSRYYELRHQDVIKFGFSSREYVLLDEAQA